MSLGEQNTIQYLNGATFFFKGQVSLLFVYALHRPLEDASNIKMIFNIIIIFIFNNNNSNLKKKNKNNVDENRDVQFQSKFQQTEKKVKRQIKIKVIHESNVFCKNPGYKN